MALEDILREDLTESPYRIEVQKVFDFIAGDYPTREEKLARSKTLGKAKSLLEFYDLVRQVIDDYESRTGTSEADKILLTEEDPDIDVKTETITLSLVSREPGAFQSGPPGQASVRNLRPRCRESKLDPENPGYRMAVTGYWYDNVVRFTCWATTNKAVNARAEWFENLMEEYSWFFKMQGVDRVLFHGRDTDLVANIMNNKWYGRPMNYFVRTEKLRVFSEKTIEEIIIKLVVKRE